MIALGVGVDSGALVQAYNERPYFVQALMASQPGSIPAPGGVLVRDAQGKVMGAVALSGDASDKDEWCAVEGIKTAGLSCTPLKENKPAVLKSKL